MLSPKRLSGLNVNHSGKLSARRPSTPKEHSAHNVLPRRLFQSVRNVPLKGNEKIVGGAQQRISPSRHPENAPQISPRNCEKIVVAPKFLSKESPTEGPEVDSPFCKYLLRCALDVKSKLRVLGRGSFGFVVFGLEKGNKLAVKVTNAKLTRNGERNALGLIHKNIVQIYRICESETTRVIVMEYAGAQNLQMIINDSNFEMSWDFNLRCASAIARALSYCHQKGIVHRDVKPSNVMVSSGGVCKLTDFGSSLSLNDPCRDCGVAAGYWPELVGTVAFLSPQVLQGRVATPKTDIYALGIVLWQLATGNTPYEGEEPHSVIYKVVSMNFRPSLPPIVNDVSSLFVKLMKQCWVHSEDQRPHASQIYKTLEEYLIQGF